MIDRDTGTGFDMEEERRQVEADTRRVPAAEKRLVGAERKADVGNTIDLAEVDHSPVEEERLQMDSRAVD